MAIFLSLLAGIASALLGILAAVVSLRGRELHDLSPGSRAAIGVMSGLLSIVLAVASYRAQKGPDAAPTLAKSQPPSLASAVRPSPPVQRAAVLPAPAVEPRVTPKKQRDSKREEPVPVLVADADQPEPIDTARRNIVINNNTDIRAKAFASLPYSEFLRHQNEQHAVARMREVFLDKFEGWGPSAMARSFDMNCSSTIYFEDGESTIDVTARLQCELVVDGRPPVKAAGAAAFQYPRPDQGTSDAERQEQLRNSTAEVLCAATANLLDVPDARLAFSGN